MITVSYVIASKAFGAHVVSLRFAFPQDPCSQHQPRRSGLGVADASFVHGVTLPFCDDRASKSNMAHEYETSNAIAVSTSRDILDKETDPR